MSKSTNEQWFIDRIGKRIFMSKSFICSHKCNNCLDSYNNGYIIKDETKANYFFTCGCEFSSDTGIEYCHFDTKEERDKYELENNTPLLSGSKFCVCGGSDKFCRFEYNDTACLYCEYNNYEMIGHPGGSAYHSVEKHWCELGYWEDGF